MKKIHNLLLASILCIGTQTALANTDTPSAEGVSSTTIEQLVSQIQSLSIEDLQTLREAVRAKLEGELLNCKKVERGVKDLSSKEHKERKANSAKDSDRRDTKKCHNKIGMKGWMYKMDGEPGMNKGKIKHRQKAGIEKQKFEKWIWFLFNKYHAKQHHYH
ncbi:MAG: hypothetical protein AAEF72_06795 [Gammaproteobacteria bacterium]